MKKLVIFSVEELYKLIHDKPVTNEKSGTIYMSRDCYENESCFQLVKKINDYQKAAYRTVNQALTESQQLQKRP